MQIEVGAQISENQDKDVLSDVVKDAVGQAVRQAVHSPHWSGAGTSGASGRSVMRHPRNSQEPSSGSITQQFFPIQPTPAYCAKTRSCTGPVSTYDRW